MGSSAFDSGGGWAWGILSVDFWCHGKLKLGSSKSESESYTLSDLVDTSKSESSLISITRLDSFFNNLIYTAPAPAICFIDLPLNFWPSL